MGQGMMIDGNDISIHQLNPNANTEILQYYAGAESTALQVEILFPMSKWSWALIWKDATVGQSMDLYFFFFFLLKFPCRKQEQGREIIFFFFYQLRKR